MRLRMKNGRHPAELIGLLGLLGLGAFWDQRFSFFSLFTLVSVIMRLRPDERFYVNMARAARNSFFVALVAVFALLIATEIGASMALLVNGIRLLFVLTLFQFPLTLMYYEWRGN